MYVCICNAVTESQIREAADAGVTNLWDLQAKLGVATNCGSCKDAAAAMFASEAYQALVPARDKGFASMTINFADEM